MTGDPDAVVAVWVELTSCGTRFEMVTADGQLHGDYRPPVGEYRFQGEDDPVYNPICQCPYVPSAPRSP
jgi:hypothetical protein